jgi:hypothetical protein
MEILDHLTFGLAAGMGRLAGDLNDSLRIAPMCGAASYRVAGVALGFPVTIRLPLAVHLTVAS